MDTFYYEHERFIFTPKGFGKLDAKINILKRIFDDASHHLLGHADSFLSVVFTARPYVYEHVFRINRGAESPPAQNIKLFAVKNSNHKVVINTRLDMLRDIVDHINNSSLPDGKRKKIDQHYELFDKYMTTLNSRSTESSEKIFGILHKIASQGFRSVIDFYGEHLKYSGSRNFQSYFSHNVLYMYMLDMMSSYCQVLPEGNEWKKRSNFPNLFLVRADAHCNVEYGGDYCKQKRKPIYLLKYLILIVVKNGVTSLKEIFEVFSDYENTVLQIALGSLATVNESNCIQLKFSSSSGSTLESMLETTSVYLTERGKFIIDRNYCFTFECLQLYWEDYLLMRPKVEHLNLTGALKEKEEYFDPSLESIDYHYFLEANTEVYKECRQTMIVGKAFRSIVLLNMLCASRTWEEFHHSKSWEKVRIIVDYQYGEGSKFLNEIFFGEQAKNIINEAVASLGVKYSGTLQTDLESFKTELINEKPYERFFDKLLSEKNMQ